MPINSLTDQLLTEVEEFFSQQNLQKFIYPHKSYDLYEVYVFTLILEAAQREEAKIIFDTPSKKKFNNNSLVFRTSPGQIYTYTENQPAYTYARLDFSQAKNYNNSSSSKESILELHLGIKIQGFSDIAHECDVCILPQREADFCRKHQCMPSYKKIIAAVECKCYEKSHLGINVGRGFLGLTMDFKSYNNIFFVSNYSSTKNLKQLLTRHSRKWEFNIIPGSQQEIESLINSFQEIFKYFKAS
ncbi:hypothetical protein [Kamptonema sp. UHCC 0994]|uniref:hypothetical protein n=1 Tax=Kamptonema sp. UHCC 0994 TaxID=3031329 RepID=UPI0023B97A7E|nr:hypothetical protein [Kamptonema sp. UHCC 0994]MDF0555079.1 hypothetical protein [Kamptonema sp. UHCC 0994]